METIGNAPPGAIKNSALIKKLAPQYSERLFYKLLKSKLHAFIDGWISIYFLNRKEALYDLYQLYVDISSYQYINVKIFLENYDISELVPYMECTKNATVIHTQKYFLILRQKSNLNKLMKLEEFVERFIHMCGKEEILYDTKLFYSLFNFLLNMTNSSERSIKHTGVFFALQHQSALIRIKGNMITKINSLTESLKFEQNRAEIQMYINELISYEQVVSKMIEFLQDNIFMKNWNYADPKLYYMRDKCIKELYKWIEIFPDLYLKEEFINIIIESAVDRQATVRLTSTEILGKLVIFHHSLLPAVIPQLIFIIASQIKERDYRVSIIAVNNLSKISKYFAIPDDIKKILFKNIYNSYFPLASACGQYLVQYIHMKYGTEGEKALLQNFILFQNITNNMGFNWLYPFAIEAVYDYFPVLQNIKVYVEVLDELSTDDIDIWVNTLTESMHQTFTGKCSLNRRRSQKRKVNPQQVTDIIKELVMSFKYILSKCHYVKLAPLMILVRHHTTTDITFEAFS